MSHQCFFKELLQESSMEHQSFRAYDIKNINDPWFLPRNHRCRILLSLMNRPIFLMTTLMNHQRYQCILDWGIYFCNCLTNMFYLFRRIEPFSLSASGCFIFYLVSFSWFLRSVQQFWRPLEVTFSSQIMSSRLHCAREFRTSNLKS